MYIAQTITFGSELILRRFARASGGVARGLLRETRTVGYAGYDCPVIMAAGTLSGPSIELSRRADERTVRRLSSGGITYESGRSVS